MKSLKSIILTTVILTLICAICTGALAFTNDLTAKRIEKLAIEAEQKAMGRIIADADFQKAEVTVNEKVNTYYVAKKDGQTVGYVFTVSGSGYGGDIKVMTGVDTEGKIIAIEVLEASNETPGLGQNITDKEKFWDQFQGKSGELVVGQSGDIAPITSATISSKAATGCVNDALELYELVKEDGK